MKKVKSFLKLPIKQQWLFLNSFFLCGFARLAIKSLSYKTIARYFGQYTGKTIAIPILNLKQISQAIAIQKAIKKASQFTPWNSNCLTQAIVAKFWCRYYRIPYALYIGITKNNDVVSSHAWVVAGPIAITGGEACFETYQVMLSYALPNKSIPL